MGGLSTGTRAVHGTIHKYQRCSALVSSALRYTRILYCFIQYRRISTDDFALSVRQPPAKAEGTYYIWPRRS